MGIQTLGPTSKTMAFYGAVYKFDAFTSWMPVTGIDTVDFIWSMEAEDQAFDCRPAYQLAAVRPDRPDDWTSSGLTALTGNGESYGSVSISAVADDHFWIRFGMEYRANSLGGADVSLTVNFANGNGQIAGRGSVLSRVYADAVAPTWTTPVGPWIPSVGVGKAKAAFIVSGVTGKVDYQLAVRHASTDPAEPGAWNQLEAGYSTAAANSTRILSDTTVTPTGAWLQFGVSYKAESGAQDGEALVDAIVATRS